MVHLGIIPDGNRRWFRENNFEYSNMLEILKLWFGRFLNLLENISILDRQNDFFKIDNLTIYVCSVDNINRKDTTKDNILKFLDRYLIFMIISKI